MLVPNTHARSVRMPSMRSLRVLCRAAGRTKIDTVIGEQHGSNGAEKQIVRSCGPTSKPDRSISALKYCFVVSSVATRVGPRYLLVCVRAPVRLCTCAPLNLCACAGVCGRACVCEYIDARPSLPCATSLKIPRAISTGSTSRLNTSRGEGSNISY